VVEQRIRPALDQPLAQPRAVPAGIGKLVRHQVDLSCGKTTGKSRSRPKPDRLSEEI
jgi:hypothetical protein